MNRACIGRTFRQEASFVRPDWAIDYAKASNDPNPLYLEGKIAPMLYPVRPNIFAVGDAVTDPDLNADLVLLLHGEQDMRFFDTLKPWDLVAPRAEILDIEDKSSGQLLKVRQRIMRDGEVVCETISGFYVRNSATGGSKKKAPKEAPPERDDYLFVETYPVDSDQSYRYAEASLDKNPIHVDENVAHAAGHKGVILHGLCTMAMTGRELINNVCDGDAARLKRLKVRFSKTVYPGDQLTTRAWLIESNDGITTIGLETLNQNGDLVISNALAEIQEA
jgi:acyl dehydratase